MRPPSPDSRPVPTGDVSVAHAVVSGLERECVRQAIHDLRGPLNTCAVLVDLVKALLDKDPDLARTKAPLVVRELQTVARMLDHLVGTSDTLATALAPVDLAAALHDAARVPMPAGIAVAVDPSIAGGITACPDRAARLFTQLLERCAAALPDGGTIRLRVEAGEFLRVIATGEGPRVIPPPDGRPHLTLAPAAVGWFELLALARGLGGDLRVAAGDGAALRVEVDFARATDGKS